MGQIVLGAVVAVVLAVVLGHWRRHRQDKAAPKERLRVGLLAAGGAGLICLVVFVLPLIPAYATKKKPARQGRYLVDAVPADQETVGRLRPPQLSTGPSRTRPGDRIWRLGSCSWVRSGEHTRSG